MMIPMSIDFAAQIAGWTYENEYSIYSFHQDDDTVKELMNGEYYACLDQFDNLSGYFCFGTSAQIPTIEKGVYTPEMLDMGLGMKPALCGLQTPPCSSFDSITFGVFALCTSMISLQFALFI